MADTSVSPPLHAFPYIFELPDELLLQLFDHVGRDPRSDTSVPWLTGYTDSTCDPVTPETWTGYNRSALASHQIQLRTFSKNSCF